MANFIISPLAISFESIRNSLQAYVASKPEDQTWKDFYASSAGETVIEIAAALGAWYAYQFIVGRRESYLSTAQNYTSLLGLAENNGYSANRGNNLKINVTFNVNQTITLPKWSIIGSYTEYDVVLLEDTILNAGSSTTIPVVIGNLLDETIQVPTNGLMQFTFTNAGVTDDCRLLLNNNEIPSSSEIKDLVNDKYAMLSNVYGAVDVFYLQQGDYNYSTRDELTLEFVERNNLTWGMFSSSNLNLDYGIVTSTEMIHNNQGVESPENIKLKAPLYHETSKVIRSRKDYSKYLLLSNPDLIAANDRDINPGLIELTYIKSNGQAMTDAEKEQWLDSIEESRPSGVARALISEPVEVDKELTIRLWKSTGMDISDTISDEIDVILAKYENVFEIDIDLNQIEHDIEQLSGIKIARVDISDSTWTANTKYNLYNTISNSSGNFYVSDYIYSTGNSEPTWPTTLGSTVVDNNIIWKNVDSYESTVTRVWEANTRYDLYDYIKKEIYTTGTYAASGTFEPVWGDSTVIDNNIVWTKVTSVGTLTWGSSRKYNLNDIITVASSGTTYYYKCTTCYIYQETFIYMVDNYTMNSGSSAPSSWDADVIYDNYIVWSLLDTGSTTNTWIPNHAYKIGDQINVDDKYFIVSSFIGKSGANAPDWTTLDSGRVYDGNLVWSQMDINNRILSLGWNQYLKLSKTYVIVG